MSDPNRHRAEHVLDLAARRPDGITRDDLGHLNVTPERAWQILARLTTEGRLRMVEEHTSTGRRSKARTRFHSVDTITEHAVQMSGGGMHVRSASPEVDRVYPLQQWIRAHQRDGGKVYRRTIIVVEDWTEVPR